MPRYFFDVLDGRTSRDDTGTECADLRTARAEAVRTSVEMVQGVVDAVRDGSDWRMEVSDGRGHRLFVVRIAVEDAPDAG